MPFFNQTSLIVDDQMRSLHNFLFENKKIVYYSFNKISNKSKKSIIVKDVTNDFDGAINQKGDIYLACKTEDNSIILSNSQRNFSDWTVIIEESEYELQNVTMELVNDEIHIFYCVSTDNKNHYKIVHYVENKNHAISKEVCSISKGEVLNPIEIIVEKDEILLTYHSLVESIEQVFIQSYDIKEQKWNNKVQLTNSKSNKLYLDVLLTDKNKINLVYCEYSQGNLVVKYKKISKENQSYKELIEKEISNYTNAQLPILIYYGQILWICWTEYNYIASRYLDDTEKDWSDIYLWNKSKTLDFIRYKYITNYKNSMQRLNYSFGRADNLGFIGFGNLRDTSIIPIKKNTNEREKQVVEKNNNEESKRAKLEHSHDEIKEKKINENEKAYNQIHLLEKKIKDIENTIATWQDKKDPLENHGDGLLQDVNERLHIVENFLIQNTRGFKKAKENRKK